MFFLYITVTEVDFLYHVILCVLALIDIDEKQEIDLIEDPDHEALKTGAAVLIVFCSLAFLVLMPLIYVQIVNIVTNTTTHDRFAFQGRSVPSSRFEGSQMLIDEEDQIFSLLSGNSAPSTIVQETTTKCCCFHTKIRQPSPSGCEEMRQNSTTSSKI